MQSDSEGGEPACSLHLFEDSEPDDETISAVFRDASKAGPIRADWFSAPPHPRTPPPTKTT